MMMFLTLCFPNYNHLWKQLGLITFKVIYPHKQQNHLFEIIDLVLDWKEETDDIEVLGQGIGTC